MTILLDGKKLRNEILEKVKAEVSSLNFQPVFCDVLVGDDSASRQYVEMKSKTAEKVGIRFHNAFFPATTTTDELVKEIQILNKVQNMCGIIIQLPLPAHIDRKVALDAIDSHLDVDCLGALATEKFYTNYDPRVDLCFPTALACMALLDSVPDKLENKNIVVLGQGELVGRPVTTLLKYRGLDPVIIQSKIEHKEELIKKADVVISGIGKGKYITGGMIKEGVVLVDAGTSEDSGSIVGDVDTESIKDIASFVSPVPGGVGPVTVAMLLNNVLQVAKNLYK